MFILSLKLGNYYSKKYIIIFVLLNIIQFIINNDELYEENLDIDYTHSLSLLNGNVFILHKNGVLVYNYNFTVILYDLRLNLIPTELDNNFTSLIQCNDNNKNYIIALINNNIYIFSGKGLFLFNVNNNNLFSDFSQNVKSQYYSFLYNKYEGSIYYFIVSFIDKNNYIKIKEFRINMETHVFSLNNSKTHGDSSNIVSDSVSCEITDYSGYQNTLACFYVIKNSTDYTTDLILSIFNLEDDLKLIKDHIAYKSFGYSMYDSNFLIKSALGKGERKVHIGALIISGNSFLGTVFDLDTFNKSEKDNYVTCSTGSNLIKINYFYFIKEYVYSCKSNTGISLAIFRNLNDINRFSIQYSNCNSFINYDVIFLSLYKKYNVISNFICQNFTSNTELYKFPLYLYPNDYIIPSIEPDMEYLVSNYSSTTKPNPTETNIPTNIPNQIETTISTTLINQIETTIPTTIFIPIESTILTTIFNPIQTTILTNEETENVPATVPNYIETKIPTTLLEPIITTIPTTIFNNIMTTVPMPIKTNIPTMIFYPVDTEIKTTVISSPSTSSTINEESCKLKKCLSCNSESLFYYLCINCNTEEDYYPSVKSGISNYYECYNEETKPHNFYFNEEKKFYEPCFPNCKTCKYSGNDQVNNCTSCKKDDIFRPDIKDSTNCVKKCEYYYYISLGKYFCTVNNQCPSQSSLLIRDKKRCVDSCQIDEEYKYEFNYECVKRCPEEETEPDENNICRLKNKKKCHKYTDNFLNVNYTDLELSRFNRLINRYIKGFEDTEFHVDFYQSNNYTITIYKELECLKELEMVSTYINFGDCYEKVQKAYNFTDTNLIILISDFFNGKLLEETLFYFFNPENGEELPIEEICQNESFTIEKSLTYYSDVNIEKAKFFDKQKINIFNTSDIFYNDLCFFFESPNGRDVPLKDRILHFYPNITLCDDSCNNVGVNLTSMKAICECKLKNLLDKASSATKLAGLDFSSIINSLSLEVMKCYKTVFQYKYFIKCFGGMISLGLIVVQSICAIIAARISIIKIKKNIFNLLGNYCSLLDSKTSKNLPPRKSSNLKLIDNSKSKRNSKYAGTGIRKSAKITPKKNSIFSRKRKYKSKSLIFNDKMVPKKLNSSQTINILNRSSSLLNNETTIKNYLATAMEELDYDEMLIREKRSFCKIFLDKLVTSQMIINLFYSKVWIIPKSIKVIFIIVMIDLYLVVNAIFYNEAYISELYYLNKTETLFSFVPRSLNRILYTSIASAVLDFIISLLFPTENKIKKILIRKKNNISEMRIKVFITTNNIINNYWIFICISYVLTIFSWFYITCFNNVYPYLKIEWIKSSIFILILMQFISILICFLYAFFRVLSIKCKSEKIHRISNYFN